MYLKDLKQLAKNHNKESIIKVTQNKKKLENDLLSKKVIDKSQLDESNKKKRGRKKKRNLQKEAKDISEFKNRKYKNISELDKWKNDYIKRHDYDQYKNKIQGLYNQISRIIQKSPK